MGVCNLQLASVSEALGRNKAAAVDKHHRLAADPLSAVYSAKASYTRTLEEHADDELINS